MYLNKKKGAVLKKTGAKAKDIHYQRGKIHQQMTQKRILYISEEGGGAQGKGFIGK